MGQGFMFMLSLIGFIWGVGPIFRILGLFCFLLWGAALCRRASPRCFGFCRPYLLVIALMCRVGEATNPGPGKSFVLGTFNPSGLKGKAPFIVSQLAHGDIWAITETHLCSQTLQTFRASLHFAQSPWKYCVAGHPVLAQSNRVFHSSWKGVAILANCPTREVPTAMPIEVTASSRALVTTSLIHDIWVTGGTIYGEPESSMYPSQKQNNEVLLHHVASHVCHLAKGPRFVAGDWNVLQNSLPSFAILENAGGDSPLLPPVSIAHEKISVMFPGSFNICCVVSLFHMTYFPTTRSSGVNLHR